MTVDAAQYVSMVMVFVGERINCQLLMDIKVNALDFMDAALPQGGVDTLKNTVIVLYVLITNELMHLELKSMLTLLSHNSVVHFFDLSFNTQQYTERLLRHEDFLRQH